MLLLLDLPDDSVVTVRRPQRPRHKPYCYKCVRGRYLGKLNPDWIDETALVQFWSHDPVHVWVQFDNRWLLEGYGWHKFRKEEWAVE